MEVICAMIMIICLFLLLLSFIIPPPDIPIKSFRLGIISVFLIFMFIDVIVIYQDFKIVSRKIQLSDSIIIEDSIIKFQKIMKITIETYKKPYSASSNQYIYIVEEMKE